MRKKDSGRIGRNNFLINFSKQRQHTSSFQLSNHHHYQIIRDVIIGIAIILVVYLLGVGVYSLEHRNKTAPTYHSKTSRVVHVNHHKHQKKVRRRHSIKPVKQKRKATREQMTARSSRGVGASQNSSRTVLRQNSSQDVRTSANRPVQKSNSNIK